MEVTRRNFQEILPKLPEIFGNAEFIAFDTEFTGLKVEGASNLNYFDTLEDLYLIDRLKAETFLAVQIGLVAFFFDNKTNRFSHTAYNFYIYPSSFLDVSYKCQSTSIQFLVQHGFDFNKLFKEGIPYLKEVEVQKLLEKFSEKYEVNPNAGTCAQIEIPSEYKDLIGKIVGRIKEISESKIKTSFSTDRHNSFIRRLIYKSVQKEFGSSVFTETNSDESMTISVGFSYLELQEKQKEKYLVKEKEILDEIGFAKVIKLLLESNKLLIGHNMFLDVLFTIKQFLAPLPETYAEFKELVKFLFPTLLDTKYMAASVAKQIKDTSLHTLVEYLEDLKAIPEVSVLEDGLGYTLPEKKFHEAAYDAFLTGLCFLGMTNHFGKVNFARNVFDNSESSSFLQPFLNKLSVPKLCDIICMNLGGDDNKPDRVGVYHMTFPEEWTRENIVALFKNFGFINICWISSTTAFIRVKKEHVVEVEKSLLGQNRNFRLLRHSEFKSLTRDFPRSSSNPGAEIKSGDAVMKNCPGNGSPISIGLNECRRKRKVEEDIGTVLERFQKKHAPADS